MQKWQRINGKSVAKCVGCSDGDALQPHCFFYYSLLYSLRPYSFKIL
jgi:hypothetical protein